MNMISLIDELYICNKFYILCKWMIIDWFFLLYCINVFVKKIGNRCFMMMVKIDILIMWNFNLIFLVNLCLKKNFLVLGIMKVEYYEVWIFRIVCIYVKN